MKLIINGAAYGCAGRPSLRDPVRFNLPGGQPDPSVLGDTVSLRDDGGTVLREIAVADYSRWYISGNSLIGTNAPEPEPVEPIEPMAEETLTQADIAGALIDLDTRVSLMEMGVE